ARAAPATRAPERRRDVGARRPRAARAGDGRRREPDGGARRAAAAAPARLHDRTEHRLGPGGRAGRRAPPRRAPVATRRGAPLRTRSRIAQHRGGAGLRDAGRLMAAPLPPGMRADDRALTRLDAAVDAVTVVGLVADELGDRCGVTIYDSEIRRRLEPRRAGGKAVIRAVLDVEPRAVDSDHDLAFRAVGGVKRALVIVCTDLVDEAA